MKPVCFITGGASGLGLELVAGLASDYDIVILSLKSPRLPVIAKKFHCRYHFCDVSEFSSVNKIITKYPRVDILINCAGVYLDGELTDNDPAQIENTIKVNSLGPINMCRAIVPLMKKQRYGTIININSRGGLIPKAAFSVYHASKYALTGFGQSLALELEPYGIKVINIYPALLNTNMAKNGHIKRDFSRALDPGEVVKLINFSLSLDVHTTLPDVCIKYI